MQNPILLFLLTLCASALSAQNKYAVSNIPAGLVQNATVVVRQHDLKLEVINDGEAIETEHKVLTLLNERAESENDIFVGYSKLIKIIDISGAIYDANGKLIRKINDTDIEDEKHYEYFVNDSRAKYVKFPRRPFPYTIEYTVETRRTNLLFYSAFTPQTSTSVAVEHATFELILPDGLSARVKELYIPENCKKRPYRWEFNNIPAMAEEPLAPNYRLPFPQILTAPSKFKLMEYEGDQSSWESLGLFISKINAGRDDLPDKTVAKLRAMTANCPDVYCKIDKVFGYLQANTRYFYVGLGIGGWQPAPAKDVDQYKYGDCKGLSNYTYAMLKAVGVPACYVLINAGEDEQWRMFPEFPAAYFNHATLCVPLPGDTIWLECTSQTINEGYVSDFTDDRTALMITPEGGKVVHTPVYDERHNVISRQTRVNLLPDGSAKLQTANIYRCQKQDPWAELADKTEDFQRKALYENLGLSNFSIDSLNIHLKKGRLPEAAVSMDLTLPKFASVSGKRLFVPAVSMARTITIPQATEPRKYAVQATSRSSTEEDNLTIAVPEGYSLENGIEPISIQSAFGTYELTLKNEPGQLIVHRKLVLKNTVLPAEKYPELIEFFKSIIKADKTKFVLAKGT